METFNLFLAYISKVIWKLAQVTVQVVHLDAHSAPQRSQTQEQLLHNLSVVVIFFVPKKILHHISECIPRSSFDSGHRRDEVWVLE